MKKGVKIVDSTACYITLEIAGKRHKVPANGYNNLDWWKDYLLKKIDKQVEYIK